MVRCLPVLMTCGQTRVFRTGLSLVGCLTDGERYSTEAVAA